MKTCNVPVCNREAYKDGYCHPHYRRKKRTGDAGTSPIYLRGNSPSERFEYYADRSGGADACHPWKGPTQRGYGYIVINYERRQAHRLAYELAHGAIPDGLVVRHTCDNPACVNLKHLEVGTPADNVQDRVERNRSARAHRNGAVKHSSLTPDDIRAIRRRYKSGDATQAELATEYGLSQQGISHICRGTTWGWVKDA